MSTQGMAKRSVTAVLVVALLGGSLRLPAARAEGEWEITPESQRALERGLEWLARNQGPQGNWGSNDLGLVALGALAFLADGHMPGRGRYGENVDRALDYLLRHAKAVGEPDATGHPPLYLLNKADPGRDMYNHGLATFVLGQAYGMTNDPRLSPVLARSLRLIAATQCNDGGWDYHAARKDRGHDLSLAVMQAKALRSAVDSGLEVPPEVINLAIQSVRGYYRARGGRPGMDESALRKLPGQFTYNGSQATLAMAAAGVVCLQEFGQYDDWRIPKSMEVITAAVKKLPDEQRAEQVPFGSYALYYVGQALYQVGGNDWRECYPILRDSIVRSQRYRADQPNDPNNGMWHDSGPFRVGGKPGDLFGTSVACFILAMPNRYLPILQEGKIESLRTDTASN
jgi:hypothetical protein